MFPSNAASLVGPVLPAMSLVPARMWTTRGRSAITSGRNRSSIWGLVWPLIPRSRNLPEKKPGSATPQASVIESPMKTAAGGAFTLALASR